MSASAARDDHAHERIDRLDGAVSEIRGILGQHATARADTEARLVLKIDTVATDTCQRIDDAVKDLKGEMQTATETIVTVARAMGSETAKTWGGRAVVYVGVAGAAVLTWWLLGSSVLSDAFYHYSGVTPGESQIKAVDAVPDAP